MKKYLTLLLFLFATLTVASSQNIPQYVDKKIHIEDVYNHFAIHHPHDVPLNKLIDGRIRNYVIYTFTIHDRSTLFMNLNMVLVWSFIINLQPLTGFRVGIGLKTILALKKLLKTKKNSVLNLTKI